ncbi:hypothetical protein CU098_000924 [Rhizopus stolonifer]|uniref:Uncharacterized protein n=1 Tax=Rhizopus stolonifer TaxID=4846 RepID=A0A367KJ59_RHIST|nr:hypothetical protein CU098_000924 [Rhizopus stolonifer]
MAYEEQLSDSVQEEIEDESYLDDSNSSHYSSGISQDLRNETMMLADFLSSTGPEEYVKDHYLHDSKQQLTRATRLLNKLRKKPTVLKPLTPSPTLVQKRPHIPITIDQQTTNKTTNTPRKPNPRQSLRDSGVYSETASEKDIHAQATVAHGPPPVPLFTSVLNDIQFPQPPKTTHSPRRPAPLPPAVASAAIVSAIRSVPEAALKRRSVRLRHVQVQTDDRNGSNESQTCPHCRQTISTMRARRPSCPPALASGPLLQEETEDAKVLLAMIMKLKSQLEEEKQCRMKLEQAIYHRDNHKKQLAKEKNRWADDCLWLNDRIALLPE